MCLNISIYSPQTSRVTMRPPSINIDVISTRVTCSWTAGLGFKAPSSMLKLVPEICSPKPGGDVLFNPWLQQTCRVKRGPALCPPGGCRLSPQFRRHIVQEGKGALGTAHRGVSSSPGLGGSLLNFSKNCTVVPGRASYLPASASPALATCPSNKDSAFDW